MGLFQNFFKSATNYPPLSVASSGSKMEHCYKNAQAGDSDAQYTVGMQYERGQFGFPQDYFEAAKWYRKAAEQGHAGAQLYLGVLLARGQGVESDFIEAYKWIELAKRGNALDKIAAVDTQKRLAAHMTPKQISEGQRLSREFIPTKGMDEELRFLQKATETGNAVDQYNLATFYSQTRIGNDQSNSDLVVKWMTLAAQQGFAPALMQLASVHELRGEPVGSEKAFEWYSQAAEQGYSDAQVQLSDIYSDLWRTGAKRDLVQAYKWLKIAIVQGETSFNPSWSCVPKDNRVDMQYMAGRMKELVGEMTADQIAEGDRLAANFVAKRKTSC